MLTRRIFAKLACAAPLTTWLAPLPAAEAQPALPSAEQPFSVMMWTLNRFGTFEQNLERVAQAGYRHVELVDEYLHWSPEDATRIRTKMQSLGLAVDAMAGMKRGFADPAGTAAFLAELKTIIPAAKTLGCRQLILLSGSRLDTSTPEQQHTASIDTLERAAGLLQAANLTGVIEPIDHLENPAIYMDGVTEACNITRAVASPHIKVLYDLYHEQRGLGDLSEKLGNNIAEIALIHIADVPGRHEPGTGEVNFCHLYRRLRGLHYTGVIAMEFYPSGNVVSTLRNARTEALHCLAGEPAIGEVVSPAANLG